jgi:hypothetical protein
MCELLCGCSSEELSETLLNEYNILIKNLSAKNGIDGQYIRVAVKTREENNLLVTALHNILGETNGTKSSYQSISAKEVFIYDQKRTKTLFRIYDGLFSEGSV